VRHVRHGLHRKGGKREHRGKWAAEGSKRLEDDGEHATGCGSKERQSSVQGCFGAGGMWDKERKMNSWAKQVTKGTIGVNGKQDEENVGGVKKSNDGFMTEFLCAPSLCTLVI
jgi:hypothetical protein